MGNAGGHGDGVNTLVDLYRDHQQRIYRYCLSLLRNPDDAEDATQETFTRAAPFLPNLPGDLSAYLTTVARNICYDVVRARARRVVPIDNLPLTDRRIGPERQNVDWDVVRRMWRQLSPAERQLFAYTFAGYKYEEIASRTGMSRPSVSVGLTRARRRMRDLAAATGTLGLLPVALRRLLARLGRRAGSALQSSQAMVVAAADQAGTVVAGLLSGLLAATGSAAVAVPAMANVAANQPPSPTIPAVGQAAASLSSAAVAVAAGHSHSAASGGAPRRTAPAPAAAGLAAGVTSDLPGGDASVPTSAPSGVTASPDYPADHTIFLWGLGQCPTVEPPSCDVLFRSTDAGATWSRLAYLTYGSGRVLLPPSYPVDRTFLVLTPNVELTADDDQGNVTWTVPGIVDAAVAPWSTAGGIQVATLSDAGTVGFYRAGGSTTPQQGPVLPGGFQPESIGYGTPGQIVVEGEVPASGTHVVTTCPTAGSCSPLVPLAGSSGNGVRLITSPQVGTDHMVLAVEDYDVFASQDGGTTFHEVFVAPGGTAIDAASVGVGPAGPRIVAGYIGGATRDRPRLVISDNAGASFTDITGSLDAVHDLLGVAAYSDGTVLAGLRGSLADTNGFALRQTTGNGTWVHPS